MVVVVKCWVCGCLKQKTAARINEKYLADAQQLDYPPRHRHFVTCKRPAFRPTVDGWWDELAPLCSWLRPLSLADRPENLTRLPVSTSRLYCVHIKSLILPCWSQEFQSRIKVIEYRCLLAQVKLNDSS